MSYTAAAAITGGAAVGGGILNMIGQKRRARDQFGRNKALMGIQHLNQRDLNKQQYQHQQELNQQGYDLQKRMWEETNYPAQMEMLREAGLNPGLLYGMSGAGGSTTGSQGGGSAQGGGAAGGSVGMLPFDAGSIMARGAKDAAEVGLIKAQTDKTKAEKDVIAETGTEEAKSRIELNAAKTENEKVAKQLMEIDKQIKTIEASYTEEKLGAEMARLWEDVERLDLDNEMKLETWEDVVYDVAQTAIGKEIENRAKEKGIELDEANIKKITQELVNRTRELEQKDRELDQRDRDLLIREFSETVKADYPNLWNAIGGGVKNSIDFVTDVVSFKNPGRRLYDTPKQNRYWGDNRRERRERRR